MWFFWLLPYVWSQTLIYLNTTNCNISTSLDCFAQNLDGAYLSLNMQNQSQLVKSMPSFALGQHELIEINWTLPLFPLRYIGISTYYYAKSDSTLVFAEIPNPIGLDKLAQACNLSSIHLLWGLKIRILLSGNQRMIEEAQLTPSTFFCTLVLPIPGPNWTNFSSNPSCNQWQNSSNLTIVIRLAGPSNETQFNQYLSNLKNHAQVTLKEEPGFACQNATHPFDYPIYQAPIASDTEMKHHNAFKNFVMQVISTLSKSYPSAQIRSRSETAPFLYAINLPEEGGQVCVVSNTDCQGATANGNYFYSPFFTSSKQSFFIIVGMIHHDFWNLSYYSSLSLYKLMTSSENSGAGVLSILDNDLRSSALGYEPLNNLNNHYYVAQFGYSTLSNLPQSTVQRTFTEQEIAIGTNIFFIARTYAQGTLDPKSLIPEVILEIILF